MMHDNTFSLLFVTIFLTYSVQCCYNVETSPLIYTTNYCTGFYIIATLEQNCSAQFSKEYNDTYAFCMLRALLRVFQNIN